MGQQRVILLVRHAEAQKNLEDRHGGGGTPLTKKGVKQCAAIAQYILDEYAPLERCLLVGHAVPQVKECVEFLSNTLHISLIWDERLRGIDLGVLAGLSREEAAKRWPEAARRLDLWRRGQWRIDRLEIPNAEPINEFRHRVEEMLTEWLKMQDVNLLIVVSTRSTLIMLVNLIRLADKFRYEYYRVYNFAPASITKVVVQGSVPRIVSMNWTDHLNDIP